MRQNERKPWDQFTACICDKCGEVFEPDREHICRKKNSYPDADNSKLNSALVNGVTNGGYFKEIDSMGNCSRNTPCIDCDNTNCVFQGKKESDCPKWHCDRPDYAKLDCDHCGFIEKFIEDMREMYNSELLKGE